MITINKFWRGILIILLLKITFMKMKTLQYILLVVVAFALTDCRTSSTSLDPKEIDGWHFHICSNETKASRLWFELSGTNGNSVYDRQEIKWQSGRKTTIAVPEGMRFMDEMNVSIRTSGKRKAKVCILYGQFVIKSVEVTGTESNKVSRENRDNCPVDLLGFLD